MFRLVDLAALHQRRLADDGAHGIHRPSACFLRSAAIPSATIRQCSPMGTPSISSPMSASASSEAVCHAARCAAVLATKRRLTLLVPRLRIVTRTGSRLRA